MTRSLGLTVESDAGGNGAKADQGSPHLVDGNLARTGAAANIRGLFELGLEAESQEHHDESGNELANALHGKDGAHHGSTPLGGSEPTDVVSTNHLTTADKETYSEVMMEERG